MSFASIRIDRDVARALVPPRPADAHKGVFGHLLVIAGSRGFTGAARLASEAASRSGVGLVTLAVPRSLGDAMAAALTEVMTVLLPGTDQESLAHSAVVPALEAAAARDAVVLGPGLSQNAETKAFVRDFVRQCARPMLIDADGLNNLGRDPADLKDNSAPRVLTPHPGEMARLTGRPVADIQANRTQVAADFAREFNCVLVLKGHATVVAEPEGPVYVNTTGNAGLAKGGTGDVLAGLIGGLLAQGVAPSDAAQLGVYLHGLAGDLAAEAHTQRAMTAGDVIACLADAWKTLESPTAP